MTPLYQSVGADGRTIGELAHEGIAAALVAIHCKCGPRGLRGHSLTIVVGRRTKVHHYSYSSG